MPALRLPRRGCRRLAPLLATEQPTPPLALGYSSTGAAPLRRQTGTTLETWCRLPVSGLPRRSSSAGYLSSRSRSLFPPYANGRVLLDALTDGVPKVPKGCLRGFWHFWHPLTLGNSRVELPNRGAERGAIQRKRDPGWKPSRGLLLAHKEGGVGEIIRSAGSVTPRKSFA
jgi:hypothetical protein